MSSAPKAPESNNPAATERTKGVKIFMYPKIVFMFPTLVMSIICWIGMAMFGADEAAPAARAQVNAATGASASKTESPTQVTTASGVKEPATVIPKAEAVPIGPSNPKRFRTVPNTLGLLFLLVFFLNMLILAVDFPRFAIFGVVLGGTTVTFFLLWLGVYVELLAPFERAVQRIYVYSNAQFYFILSVGLLLIYGIIMATRWLDYWEIMPNEILHHHGPLSDLERFPTMNLKFDKEIPDVFEHMLLGAGRLVLHIPSEHKAIVLDTVLHVSRKEDALKKLMSRLDVRVTTDQEVAS